METRENSRLEAFSDGVFAISITLLGLELKLPKGDDKVALIWGLVDQWPVYVAFIVSFFTLLMMWYIHSIYFRFLKKANKEIFYANGLILMWTVAIPFVNRIMAEYFLDKSVGTAISIYTGFGPFIALSYFWLIDAIYRGKKFHNQSVNFLEIKKVRNKSALGPFAYAAAFALSFFLPYVALIINISINLYWAFTKLEFEEESTIE